MIATPPLRRRVTRAGVLVVAVLLVAFDAFVYLSVSHRLEASLDDLLSERLAIAEELAEGIDGRRLVEQLVAVGIPAVVHAPDGRVWSGGPATPRVGSVSPPTTAALPRLSRTTTVADGTVVEVFATRAGIDSTLRQLLSAMALGTLAAVAAAYALLRRTTSAAVAPLDAVVTTAERITAGATGERLSPDRVDSEVGRMAAAFDEMLDALEAAVSTAIGEQERTRRFLADAAHQLRTPLAGIRASTELLLQEADPEDRDALALSAVRETDRVSRLVTRLLHISRLDAPDPLELAMTDVVQVCREEGRRAQELSPCLDVTVEVEGGRPPPIPADAAGLGEALANLLDNARRHARSHVVVRVSGAPDAVTVVVADDGCGIPADVRELAFDRFTTLDGGGGSGLGLPIARAVARAHGGDLTAEDDGLHLRLPTRTSAVTHDAPGPPPAPPAPGSRGVAGR